MSDESWSSILKAGKGWNWAGWNWLGLPDNSERNHSYIQSDEFKLDFANLIELDDGNFYRKTHGFNVSTCLNRRFATPSATPAAMILGWRSDCLAPGSAGGGDGDGLTN